MENNLHNNYLFQALDAYPYDLEQTLEALNYALSYNPKDAHALWLMGRVYAEQLRDFEAAKSYFEEAVTHQLELTKIYPYYIQTLLWNEDYQEAQKLLDYASTLKSSDKAWLQLLQGLLFERQADYDKAKTAYKVAIKIATNNCFITHVEAELERLKKKVKPKKKKNKTKNNSKKKRKEK